MSTTFASEAEQTLGLLCNVLGDTAPRDVSFKLWDGTLWPDCEPRRATIVLKHPGAVHAMFGSGTEKGLGEAFLHDDFDVEGEIEAACELADVLRDGGQTGWLQAAKRVFQLHRSRTRLRPARTWTEMAEGNGRVHSRMRDRQAVTFHYDLSNDFYRLWLDSRMLYSCAYFERETDDLETAQLAKLNYLCRKLRLRPGQRLLDIGCGWGGLAMHAARHFGVRVMGITLSAQQASLADERVSSAGLNDRVAIEVKDYRDVQNEEGFDAIVSVGMAEHVGEKNLPVYFEKAYSLLKPGGVFLNHAIGDDVRHRRITGDSFIQEYVFPDAELPPISRVLIAAEAAGFEVRDVENLREHYTLTLRHWVRRLEQAHEAALNFVDEPTYRTWRVYMAASARGVDCARLAIYQSLLVRLDEQGRAPLPLTRRDWYDD